MKKSTAFFTMPLTMILVAILQILMIGLTLCLIFGFGHVRSEANLIGTYDTEYRQAKEILILYPDHTFLQKVTLKKTGKIDISKGTWRFDPSDGEINFEGAFIQVLDFFGKFNPDYAQSPISGFSMPTDWIFSGICFGHSDYYVYIKQRDLKNLKNMVIEKKQAFLK
ncbi:MAG: hypothetical protein AB7F28_08685 [Candidatus Margulisiibacteriota bacterium]